MKREKVLFLSYGYMPSGRLEPYRERLIQILAGADCEVLVIKTNSFFHEYSHVPRYANTLPYLLSEIRRFQPDVIVSINRTGLCPEILAITEGIPIVTLFQDPHYYATDELLKFSARDFLFFIDPNPDYFEQKFIPFAVEKGALSSQLINIRLSLDTFTFFSTDQSRELDVSFVGSSFGNDFAKLLIHFIPNTDVRNILIRTFLAHRKSLIADIPQALRGEGIDFEKDEFYRSLGMTRITPFLEAIRNGSLRLQGIFDDQINAERRIHHLAALADFNFKMYGLRDDIWIEQMAVVKPELLACYQYRAINEPEELAAIYNRSKIGFNISRIAAADKGFSFRVPELMACGTLVVTEHFSRMPLSKMGFVEGKHFIAYESPEDLRQKCSYYLSHESERLAIVTAAKRAIENLGPETTIHGGLALCMRHAGFSDLASRIESLTKSDIHYTNRVSMHGDFRGAFQTYTSEDHPRVIDLAIRPGNAAS